MCNYLHPFAKNGFTAIFDGHIESLRKMQKRIYRGNGATYSHFDEIFDLQGIRRVIWNYLPKIVFPPFSEAILKLCVKCKSVCILETVRDSAIPTKFVTPGVYTESSATVC